jgi:Type I phosphodiesterase / nucleotide pyrophosphatase
MNRFNFLRQFVLFAILGLLAPCALSVELFAKNPAVKTSLTPLEIFRLTASQWSGDIFLLPKKGNFMLDASELNPKNWQSSTINGRLIPPHPITMHGVAWDYDLRIPIVFYDPTGNWFKKGQYNELAVQQDIAPTLASILDVPAPAKNGGRVLKEAMIGGLTAANKKEKPKAIIIFVQDQMGRQYLAAQPGKAKFYESLISNGANYRNGSVAHVDVETSVGHAAIGTGAWPGEHGVSGNNLFHTGIWRQVAAMGIQTGPSDASKKVSPSMFFTPTISDVWSVSRSGKPVILSVAPAPRAAIGMGGHGALFNGGVPTYITWLDSGRDDGAWTTEDPNYQMPEAFKNKPILPWIKPIVDSHNQWRGHEMVGVDGKINEKVVTASPALVRQQGELTRNAISELKIGQDDETDFVWINTKATDYCGHLFGFESDECGDVLAAADDEAHKIVDQVDKQTNGNFLVVLTADHGAAPLPEIAGTYRLDRSKLKADLNAKFDHRDNNLEAIQLVTSSQIYLNLGELTANGYAVNDVIKFLKQYKGKMSAPYNALADEWIKKGKAREAPFFEVVVDKKSLQSLAHITH